MSDRAFLWYTVSMQVTYIMGDTAHDALFCADYFHLYHRLRRIADNLASLFLYGELHLIVPEDFSAENVPKFCAATFEQRDAFAYERRVERSMSRRHAIAEVPKPAFPIRLDVRFSDGAAETFCIEFSPDYHAAVETFCRNVCARARAHYRRRFAAPKAIVDLSAPS